MVESTPNPSYVALVTALVRAGLQIAAGAGFTWALAVNGDQVQMAVSALIGLGTVVWSEWQKVAAARREHQIAVASARGAKAVQPVSTPV